MFGSKLMDQTNFCLTNKSCLILTQHFDCNEGYFRNLLLQHLALCSISEWLNMKISFLEVTQSMFLFSFLRAFYPVALRKVDTRRRILSPFFSFLFLLFILYLPLSVLISPSFSVILSPPLSVYFCFFSLYFSFPFTLSVIYSVSLSFSISSFSFSFLFLLFILYLSLSLSIFPLYNPDFSLSLSVALFYFLFLSLYIKTEFG